jgi:hypothetical protein
MRRADRIAAAIVAIALGGGCNPTADERCGGGYVWKDGTCIPEGEADTGTESGENTDADAGDADGGDGPSGLGVECSEDGGECEGFEADYCALQPGQETGYCTVANCSTDPDDCYGEYSCCDFPYSGVPNFCVTPEDYEILGSTCDG